MTANVLANKFNTELDEIATSEMQCISVGVPRTLLSPLHSALGGIILGLTTVFFLATTGRLIGLSGVFEGVFTFEKDQFHWKILFTCGFMFAAQLFMVLFPKSLDQHGLGASWTLMVLGGFFVGCGTRLANGCTSGHGICGMARLSHRSITAVLMFMASAFTTSTAMFGMAGLQYPADEWDDPKPSIALSFFTANVILAFISCFGYTEQWKESIYSLAAGFLFSVGIIVAGMGRRPKVLNFLLLGVSDWDYSLLFVLGFAVIICFVFFRVVLQNLCTPLMCHHEPRHKESDEVQADKQSVSENEKHLSSQAQAKLPACSICKFCIPTNADIDLKLVIGACLFGIGWGLTGLCPGPAIIQCAAGIPKVTYGFLPAMIAGVYTAKILKTL